MKAKYRKAQVRTRRRQKTPISSLLNGFGKFVEPFYGEFSHFGSFVSMLLKRCQTAVDLPEPVLLSCERFG